MTEAKRECTCCGRERPSTKVWFRVASSGGLDSRCKPCRSIIERISYYRQAQRRIEPMESVERKAILRAIAACFGDIRKAAQRLGIGRATVYTKLKQYGEDPAELVSKYKGNRQLEQLQQQLAEIRRGRKAIVRQRRDRALDQLAVSVAAGAG